MLVVVEGALLELADALLDLGRIGHRDAADVDPPVDDAVLDPLGGGQNVDAGVERTQRDVGRLGRDHVEVMHRLGEVHRVVEPELLVILGHELGVVRIGRLRAFGAGHDLEVAGQGEALLGHRWQTSLADAPFFQPLRHCEERSDEPSGAALRDALDCFATLAMTKSIVRRLILGLPV